jgi:hypothetical protein
MHGNLYSFSLFTTIPFIQEIVIVLITNFINSHVFTCVTFISVIPAVYYVRAFLKNKFLTSDQLQLTPQTMTLKILHTRDLKTKVFEKNKKIPLTSV